MNILPRAVKLTVHNLSSCCCASWSQSNCIAETTIYPRSKPAFPRGTSSKAHLQPDPQLGASQFVLFYVIFLSRRVSRFGNPRWPEQPSPSMPLNTKNGEIGRNVVLKRSQNACYRLGAATFLNESDMTARRECRRNRSRIAWKTHLRLKLTGLGWFGRCVEL